MYKFIDSRHLMVTKKVMFLYLPDPEPIFEFILKISALSGIEQATSCL